MKRFLILILCMALCLSQTACASDNSRTYMDFYYYRMDSAYGVDDGVLISEVRDMAAKQDDLTAAMELYLEGPETDGLESPFPDDLRLLSWSKSDDVLELHFNEALAALAGIELTVAGACLARTFLTMTDTQTLLLTADGALLNGSTSFSLSEYELMLSDDTPDRLRSKTTVYYFDPQRRYLIGSSVTVDLNDPQSGPAYLLEQLLTPPSGSGLAAPLPSGTRIRAVRVEDGLCTVDLSAEFENRRFYSRRAQLLSLFSIVNTLTELDGIDRVEISVDGDLLIRYGALTISEPLVRDTRFIGPVRTALGETDASVYLCHGSEGGLLEIPVRLRRTNAVTHEELLMKVLLEDEGRNGLSSKIPAGTELNHIELRGEICHVDLSAAYLSAPADLPWSGRVIAATLCSSEGISGVRITVDGAIPEGFDSGLFGLLVPEKDWYL